LHDLTSHASTSVSAGADSAQKALDGNSETIWSAGSPPPQSYGLNLDKYYLVSRIELVVAQAPNGQTSHEIWLGNSSGKLTLYKSLVNVFTADGQTTKVDINPPILTDRVMIRTTSSPSFVAWREVRVLGQEPSASASAKAGTLGEAATVVDWPKLKLSGDFTFPVQITNAEDESGRTFVSELKGRVRILKGGTLVATPFLDITDRVKCCSGEQGFFSIAFPPGFAKKRYFYASYISKTHGDVGDLIVARYHLTSDANVADPKSEEIILTIPQPTEAHHGGQLEFGPKDGFLYIGSGDGGLLGDGENVAQDLSSLRGKILRVDVESGKAPYAIPPSNPFVQTGGAKGEIWALGLRNPWKFTFDRANGDLYISDVGDNAYEEIDYQPAASKGGENYGWPKVEGNHCRTASCDDVALTAPVAEYSHTDGCAVVGGKVYRGTQFKNLDGIYFYSDFCSGRIWGLKRVGDSWQSNLLDREAFGITDIGDDEAGNLYVADYAQGLILNLQAP
jgi:glucose/arabinose dehydrogenase